MLFINTALNIVLQTYNWKGPRNVVVQVSCMGYVYHGNRQNSLLSATNLWKQGIRKMEQLLEA